VPKKIQELSQIYKKLVEFTAEHDSGAENHEVLALIEDVDALRRNKRFNKALKILGAGKTDNEKITAIDTGCVWGYKLSAYRLEDSKVFSYDRITK
jgi:hypothetical protein